MRLWLLGFLAPIAGCAADGELASAKFLLGKSRAEVLACNGLPARVETEGGAQILVYSYSSKGYRAWRMNLVGSRAAPSFVPTGGEREWVTCDARVHIGGGRVTRVDYRGGDAGVCDRLARNCAAK